MGVKEFEVFASVCKYNDLELNFAHTIRFVSDKDLYAISRKNIQCQSYIATLDKAAALTIVTSTPVTDLHQYINSNLVYNDLKIRTLCSK